MFTSLEIKAAAVIALVVALLIGKAAYDSHEQKLGRQAGDLAAAQAQEAEHERVAKLSFRNNEIAGDLATTKADREVQYATIVRTVDRLVDRPVYRDTCLDADGLRSINAALAGKSDDPGIAASAVPAASAP